MVNLDYLEANKTRLRMEYLLARPFPYLVIDDFCDAAKLAQLYGQIPELDRKSRWVYFLCFTPLRHHGW